MTATQAPPRAPASPWATLRDALRERDDDPAYAARPRVDVYARISRDDDGNLEKTDRQTYDCLRGVESRGWRFGEVVCDDNLSAWKKGGKRPGFLRLCERLQSRQTDGVIVWHTDRLMRQPRDLERLIDLADAGCQVASCHGDYDLADSDARFMLRVITAAAAKESDNTSRRQKRKMQDHRQNGKFHTAARPFGFPGNGPDKTPVPDDQVAAERAAIVWGAQAHIDGLSLSAIAREWDGRGLHTARGRPFVADSVRAVLLRARNAALIEHKGVVVGRAVDEKPILSEETLDAVRATFAARRLGRPVTTRYLLSGMLLCGSCGNRMTGVTTTDPRGTKRARYACRKGCGKVSIDMARSDAVVRALTMQTLTDPQHITQVVKRSKAAEDLDRQITDAEAVALEIGGRLGRGEIGVDRHDAIMEPLDRRLARLRGKRDALLAQGSTDTRTASASADEIERLWGDDDDAGPELVERRRGLVRRASPLGLNVAPASQRRTFDAGRIKQINRPGCAALGSPS